MNNGQRNQMPPLRTGGPGGRGGPMLSARVNKEKPKNTGRTLARLLKYVGKNKLLIVCLIFIMVIVTVSDLAGPALQGAAIDTITVEDGRILVDFAKMTTYLLCMGVIFVISATMSLFQGIIAAKLSQSTVFMMRNDLFKKISRLPINYTDTHKHGDIMSRMTNDVEIV